MALAELHDEACVPRLIELADHDDPDLAAAAIHALGSFTGGAVSDRLTAALRDDRLEVQVAAIGALAAGQQENAASLLLARLDEVVLPSDAHQLDEILIALRLLGDPRSEAALADILASDHAGERSHPLSASHGDLAAEALEAFGTPMARAASAAWRTRGA